MKLSKSQKNVLLKLISWFKSSDGSQTKTLGGYAGTGKTTIAAVLRHQIHKINPEASIAFCSYTGKATRVLKSTLEKYNVLYHDDTVSTIHSLIYEPVTNKKNEIIGWKLKENTDISAQLIVIDEASMLDKEIWHDLLSYNKPILAIGDHGQLPPIKGEFNLLEKPELVLEEIHRQAADNPIIKLSIWARERGFIPEGQYSQNVKKIIPRDYSDQDDIAQLLAGYNDDTLVLSGYNYTRVKLNKFIRNQQEIHSESPVAGDRVICLRNNHEKQIYNGMIGTIRNISEHDETWYQADIDFDADDSMYSGLIARQQFGAKEAMNFTQKRGETIEGDLFDFGYALTVHKAQGSQAKRVILFEERFSKMDDDMWKRWLYTAVTRAQEDLFIFGKDKHK